MEFVVGFIVAALTAVLGGWFGFFLAKRRDDKNRAADICLELYSGDFSKERTTFLAELRALTMDEVKLAAKRDVAIHSDLRQRAFDIFNKYDLICYLKNSGALDNKIFDDYALSVIAPDYAAADEFFQAVEEDYTERNVEDRRPFFPEIHKVAPRA